MEIHEQQSVLDVTVYVTSEIRHSSYIYVGLKVLQKEKYLNTLRFIPERYYHKDRVVIDIEEISSPVAGLKTFIVDSDIRTLMDN